MGYFGTGWKRIPACGLAALVVTLALAGVGWVLLPRVPAASAAYDCDDGALAMYRHFRSLGIAARPIIGNLDRDGEAFSESNHVWLLVNILGRDIAYDWGRPRFDAQHYEGYGITLDDLLTAVAADDTGGATLLASSH
jgi:hypothetical protein